MIVKTIVQFEENDLDIIKNTPPEPCSVRGCTGEDRVACCGCPEERNWNATHGRRIKERNLEECYAAYSQYKSRCKEAKKAMIQKKEAAQVCESLGLSSLLDEVPERPRTYKEENRDVTIR